MGLNQLTFISLGRFLKRRTLTAWSVAVPHDVAPLLLHPLMRQLWALLHAWKGQAKVVGPSALAMKVWRWRAPSSSPRCGATWLAIALVVHVAELSEQHG